MNTIKTLVLLAGLSAGITASAAEPVAAPADKHVQDAAATTHVADAVASPAPPAAAAPVATNAAAADSTGTAANPAAPPASNHAEGIVMNFNNAPLASVLSYLSEAAGFIILSDVRVHGTITVVSKQPMTKDEAVDLLNSELNRNGYGAIRNDRTLTIVAKDEIKTRGVPVKLWNGDPESIPKNDEVITAILPVNNVEVAQLMKDLQVLVSPTTPMTANESGNSIVITDTQSTIRRVAEVIKAIDMGAEDVTVVKVFHLQHSNPQEMSDLITNLFPDDSRGGGSQTPVQFGGGLRGLFGGAFGRGGGFGGGNRGGQAGGGQNQRIRKHNRVIAVPELRTSSVVITASKALMDQIGDVIGEIDADASNMASVAVIPIEHAEPSDIQQVMNDIFNKNGTQNTRNSMNQQQNVLLNRATQQNQQLNNNSGSRSGMGGTGGRGGMGGGGGFGG